MRVTVALEQCGGKRAVRVHAVEAVIPGRYRGGEHLALGAAQRGALEVMDEQLVRQAAQVNAEARGQVECREDPRRVGQSSDDRPLLCTLDALVIAGHRRPPAIE